MVVVRGHKFCLFELRNCCGMCKWSSSNDGEVVHIRLTMVTLYWIAFVPPRKSYQIGILFTHMNGDFDAISMTERNGVTPISKVESHVLDTLGVYTLPNRPCRVGLLLTALVFHLFMYYLAILLRWSSPWTFLKLFKSLTARVLNIKSTIQLIFSWHF